MTRVLDIQRTKEARERQAAGVKRLDEAFRIPDWLRRMKGTPVVNTMNGLSLTGVTRTRLGCPPIRDEATKARHQRRKDARKARRRNRP